MNNFTVYSREGCPYCEKIKEVMQLAKLQHRVYDLGTDFTREEFYSQFGYGSTFPQVVVDNKNLGGCIDAVKYLREQKIIWLTFIKESSIIKLLL